MAKKVKVFHGVGVCVAEVKDNTKYSLLAIVNEGDKLDFKDPKLRFEVDLGLAPRECGHGKFDEVLAENIGVFPDGTDIAPGAEAFKKSVALTSIGSIKSKAPQDGGFLGGVYLEHKLHKDYRAKGKFPGYPGAKFTFEQLTSIVRIDEDNLRMRYHGFLGEVKKAVGDQITVTVTEDNVTREITFTKGDAAIYDPKPPKEAFEDPANLAGAQPETNLADNLDTVGAKGVLFIEIRTAVAAKMRGPKIPSGLAG